MVIVQMVGDELTILVIDDNESCRDLYAVWLGESHDVRSAPDGRAGLEMLDADVDLVVLDREMPGPSGTDVARDIAAGAHDPHVAMVSGKELDFDLAEFPVDDYLRKPVDGRDLQTVVGQFQVEDAYHAALDELFSLTDELAALESACAESELATSDEYRRLQRRVAEKRAEVEAALSSLDADWPVTFETIFSPASAPQNA